MNIAAVITEIQSFGVRIHQKTLLREGGAGPAEAGSLIIDGKAVNAPVTSPFVSESPYHIEETGGQTILFKAGKELLSVGLVTTPAFYTSFTEEGIPYTKIALLHGKDCLATSIIQTCLYWKSDQRCRFCGIELSLQNKNTIPTKTPAQIAQVAAAAREQDHVNHIVLTTGTGTPPGSEVRALAECTQAIKERTELPVHVQFQPPPHMESLHMLKEAGVDTVGIHMESFDPDTLSRIAPAKAAIGLKRYQEAWKTAVELFGPNQVSSFVLAGLGEKPDSVISGSAMLADLGVYPFVVPLRPIPGSRMAQAAPPDPEIMKPIYRTVAHILAEKGLSSARSLAGCVRCGACSALPAYERTVERLVCHPARTRAEHLEANSIRKTVFVEEQKIFKNTDTDENDSKSIHLVAKQEGNIIGTVRVYPAATGNGDWIGGRLSVKKGFRASGAGELLVNEAVALVKKNGCSHFTAHIQKNNIAFFEQLGWKGVGPLKDHFGKPHQVMEADLEDRRQKPEGREEPWK